MISVGDAGADLVLTRSPGIAQIASRFSRFTQNGVGCVQPGRGGWTEDPEARGLGLREKVLEHRFLQNGKPRLESQEPEVCPKG